MTYRSKERYENPFFQDDMDVSADRSARKVLFQHVVLNPEIHAAFFTETGAVRVQKVKDYVNLHQKWVDLLVFLVHISSGMPARSTELSSLSLINCPDMPRSVFFVDGQIMTVTLYNKTTSVTDRLKPIARFLDSDLSLLTLQDILVIRPFVAYLSKLAGLTDAGYMTYLFAQNGEPMTSDQILDIFPRMFYLHSGVSLKISLYRQLVKHFARSLNCELVGQEDPFDDQMGHSSATSIAHYGRTNAEHRHLTTHQVNQFRTASTVWQQFISPRPLIFHHEFPLSPSTSCPPPQPPLSEEIMSFRGGPSGKSVSGPLSTIRASDTRVALDIVRKLVSDPEAGFLCSEQQEAIETVLFTNRDVIVILGTGKGKSLVIGAYALMSYSRRLTSVLVVPTLALRDDISMKFRSLNISVCTQSSRFTDESLLIVTPEAIVCDAFGSLMRTLQTACRIGKIFVDEAHLFLLGAGFRPEFRSLTSLNSFGMPLICLSATASSQVVEDLTAHLYLGQSPHIIKGDLSRLNLYLKVERGQSYEHARDLINLAELEEKDRAIVFVSSKHDCELLHRKISSSCFYHGDMTDQDRLSALMTWKSGIATTMVATTSFSLGIDYPNVRIVITVGLPFTMDEYVQQVGRAGRDGRTARCILLFDEKRKSPFYSQTETVCKEAYDLLEAYARNNDVCRHRMVCSIFGQTSTSCPVLGPYSCDNCLKAHGENSSAFSRCPEVLRSSAGELAVSVFKPATPARTTPNVHRQSLAADLATKIGSIAEELRIVMDFFTTHCAICLLLDRPDHLQAHCPYVEKFCYKCYSTDHAFGKCNREAVKLPLCCFYCLLPDQIGNFAIHLGPFSKECRYKDILKTYVAYKVQSEKLSPRDLLIQTDFKLPKVAGMFINDFSEKVRNIIHPH